MSQTPPSDPARPDPERLLAMLCYALFLLAMASGITGLIGVILAYIRREPAAGTVYASHYANLITVFWVSFAVGILSLTLLFNGLFAGFAFLFWRPWHVPMFGWPLAAMAIPLALFAGILFAVWYLYRVLRGFVRALDEKPYRMPR